MARAAVPVNEKQIAAAPVVSRAVVAPTRDSVLGTSAPTANRVAQPPAAVVNRPVVAKTTPPPPPVPFARQQQELAKHPGQPLAAHEVQVLRPANVAAAQPLVKQAPPGKPATLNTSRPVSQPDKFLTILRRLGWRFRLPAKPIGRRLDICHWRCVAKPSPELMRVGSDCLSTTGLK